MVRREENRRILAVDDEDSALAHYQQIFCESTTGGNSEVNQRLLQTLQAGLESPLDIETTNQKREPYELECFSQGGEAVVAVERALMENRPYAVALVDMRMLPGIDGLETAKRMRQLDEALQIIFITAYSDYDTDRIFEDVHGPVFWFRKPFETEEMYATVRSCCDSWNQAHELRLLRKDLADRVELQTERLEAKVQSVMVLQNNSLKRELMMGEMKRELRSLKAYQDLRLLLKDGHLEEPRPLDLKQEPVQLLLVDDSPTVRAINKAKLEKIGFAVEVAESADQAYRIALKQPFEVALIDFYMPGGNGDRLISMLREDPETMYILPLLFTNAGDEMMAVEAGAVYWMTKDQEQFTSKMELLRDYIQDSRSFQGNTGVLKQLENNRRVLLVDDDPLILEMLRSLLTPGAVIPEIEYFSDTRNAADQLQDLDLEFDVTSCQQGEEAIIAVREAQFEEQPFAVAMIDMRMPPGMGGLETARQIRQLSPQIDIIIMSAFSDHTMKEARAILGDNFSYLSKPFRPEEVVQRIIEGCAKWAMVREVNASHHALLNLADDMDKENIRRREAEEGLAEASQALKQEKIYMEEIFSSMREPLMVVDHNGMVEECNTALLKLISKSRESVIRQPVENLFDEEQQFTLMETVQQLFKAQLQQVHDHDPDVFHQHLEHSESPLLVVSAGADDVAAAEIFLVSRGARKLLGYSAESLKGEPLLKVLEPAETEKLDAQLKAEQEAVSCGAAQNYSWSCADGTHLQTVACNMHIQCGRHHHQIVFLNTEDESRNPLLFMDALSNMLSYAEADFFNSEVIPQVSEEITNVQQSGESLERYLREFALPVVLGDESGQIVCINMAMEQLCGWRRDEIAGMPFSVLLPAGLRDQHQQQIKQFMDNPRLRGMGVNQHFPLRTFGGKTTMVKVGLIPTSQNGEQQVVAVLLDEENLESLKILRSTHGQAFSLHKNEILLEDRLLHVAGQESVPVAVSGSLLHDSTQHSMSVVLMLHDLRERKRSEQREQYAAFQSGVAEMTVNILHNIGNTIQGMDSASSEIHTQMSDIRKIQGLYQRFADALEAAEDQQKSEQLVEKVLEASRRLPDVLTKMQESWSPSVENLQTGIQHIKEVVRLQQKGGVVNVHNTRFSISQLLDDLKLLTINDIDNRRIKLVFKQKNKQQQEVKLPRNQLIQALINLVKNSAQAIGERMLVKGLQQGEGRIELAVEIIDQQLMIVVRDNGNGFDPEIGDNLMQFGFTTKIDGSGFGLHATANFVNANEGSIKIESEGVGQGATATILLPTELE